ncbi:hypothetical protein BMS3Abin05_02069 [bacterium BMS3Abin05]|nr:hypothetical protein BMS3Abin05_02069 [bacterium BMS3Abin05]GBE27515.1 hypothetical protein BMS3Bbin03_01442 [bacterium BMS3Bbin03]HDK35858.1 nuclease [Bacteroidota bacterium]HDL78931.1 nuclease [Bacteroidota bacterium]HDZ12492.1 nuclease [Bacteroidota bacterium]
MIGKLYHYRGRVVSVYDGDTIHVDIDLGLYTWRKNEKIRLARINAPELRGSSREKGVQSRDFLRELILDKAVLVQTQKDRRGKWGRFVAEIWIKENDQWVNVNDRLVQKGFAEYVDYS